MFKLNKKGFTLIELLVVIAIIGVLGSIVFAPFNEARKKGRDGKRIAELKGVQSSLLLFSEDASGCFPDTLAAAAAANKFDKLGNKYITPTLHAKIRSINNAAAISTTAGNVNAWSSTQPYMLRSLGDSAQCTATALNTLDFYPYYQLAVELETHTTGLDGDADAVMTPAAAPVYTGKNLANAVGPVVAYNGLDLSPLGQGAETCTAFATASLQCLFDLSNN